MSPIERSQQAHILIVDDIPNNIQIVASMLKQSNCRLSFAQSGQIALSLVAQHHFDLILLDVQMPVMDGFQVCEILKSRAETRHIPIIFLTANAGAELSVHGFSLGAVDYITKPVEPNELRARVTTHLDLKFSQDKILEQNQHLAQLNQEKNRLLEIVSHDLRSPLTVLVSGLEYLHRYYSQPEKNLERRLHNMQIATERMENMLYRFLNQESISVGKHQLVKSHFLLNELIDKILSHYQEPLHHKEISIILEVSPKIGVYSDQAVLEQVFDNLISNAIKFSPSKKNILIDARRLDSDEVEVMIQDQGPGFTAEELPLLFEKTGRLSACPTSGEISLGLGLSIVKNLMGYVQGEVRCTSEPHTGACFRLCFPSVLSEDLGLQL